MTPRQKKRQMRASAKGRPLSFIRFRAIHARMVEATSRAMFELMTGQKSAVQALREHITRELLDMVLRPIVRRVVRDMAGVYE